LQAIKLPFDARIALSKNGARALVGSRSAGIHLYETATGKKLLTLPDDKGLEMVAMCPDGHALATATSTGKKGEPARVFLWNAEDGKQIGPALLHPLRVARLAFSPDGKTLASACVAEKEEPGNVPLWNTDNGEQIGPALLHPRPVAGLAFCPDGKTLATSCADGKLRFWQCATGTQMATVLEQPAAHSLSYSLDGRFLLCAGEDRQASLWDLEKAELVGTYPHPGIINAVAIAPGAKTILIGGHDMTARLWNVTTAKPIGPPLTHPAHLNVVGFSPDGHMAVTGSEGKVQLWEASTGQPIGPSSESFGFGAVRACAFAADGQTLVVGAQLAICSWQTRVKLAGSPQQLVTAVQALTGMELNSNREIQALDPNAWNRLRVQLQEEGQPVLP
jgi:WD40 repeat protein